MATATAITAAKALELWAASVKAATINGSGHIIFTRMDNSTFDGGDFSTTIASLVATEVSNQVAGTKFSLGTVTGAVSIKDVAGVTATTLVNSLFTATLTGNITIDAANMPVGAKAGTQVALRLTQDATGGRTLTLTGFKKSQGVLTLTTTANAVDIVVFMYDGTTWFAGMMGVDFK